MAMATAVEQFRMPCCANCGIEIPWRPANHHGRTYCCGGCAQGGPCYCSYDLAILDWQPRARTAPPQTWLKPALLAHAKGRDLSCQ